MKGTKFSWHATSAPLHQMLTPLGLAFHTFLGMELKSLLEQLQGIRVCQVTTRFFVQSTINGMVFQLSTHGE